MKISPKRVDWATFETMGAAGGHYRKGFNAKILEGATPQLHPYTQAEEGESLALKRMAKLTSFRAFRSKGLAKVFIGFIVNKRLGFKSSVTKLARKVVHGRKEKIKNWKKLRKKFSHQGIYLRKSTKYIKIPKRDIVAEYFNSIQGDIPKYVNNKFFAIYFSNRRPDLEK